MSRRTICRKNGEITSSGTIFFELLRPVVKYQIPKCPVVSTAYKSENMPFKLLNWSLWKFHYFPFRTLQAGYLSHKDIIENKIQGEACPYADACTFCYNEEEQEIWAWERRGLFNRTRLFTETVVDPVAHFLRQYQGTFFICCELHLEDPPSCHCPNKNVCSRIIL